jgi:membrane-associated phospholipid phosphatase
MDIQYLLFLQNLRNATGGVFNTFFMFITDLGWSIWPPLIIAAIYWSMDKQKGKYIFIAATLSSFLANLIKLTACIYRPWVRSKEIKPVDAAFTTATGYSFPSGHMSFGTPLWGGIALTCKKNRAISISAVIIMILVGFSRNYVGVHTPQDVLVGFCVGVLSLWLGSKVMKGFEADGKFYLRFMILMIVLGVAAVLYASLKSYPMDYVDGKLLVDPHKLVLDGFGAAGEVMGLGIGLYLEQKQVNFTTAVSGAVRIGRFLTGLAVYALIFYTLGALLKLFTPAAFAAAFPKFMCNFYILYLHPLCFTAYEKKHAAELNLL